VNVCGGPQNYVAQVLSRFLSLSLIISPAEYFGQRTEQANKAYNVLITGLLITAPLHNSDSSLDTGILKPWFIDALNDRSNAKVKQCPTLQCESVSGI
jgi:hypothetical protein